jgi:hypothetical protein
MSTFVSVNTYTHSVTYVTDNILRSLKLIILLSGLSPEKLTSDWEILEKGIKIWLEGEYLKEVYLEVYDPRNNKLIGRWDFKIRYGFTGDGGFWVDTDDIRYHIQKASVWPSRCDYGIVVTTKAERPDVPGWSKTSLRSIEGLIRQSIGTTIDGFGLSAVTSYWRRA